MAILVDLARIVGVDEWSELAIFNLARDADCFSVVIHIQVVGKGTL